MQSLYLPHASRTSRSLSFCGSLSKVKSCRELESDVCTATLKPDLGSSPTRSASVVRCRHAQRWTARSRTTGLTARSRRPRRRTRRARIPRSALLLPFTAFTAAADHRVRRNRPSSRPPSAAQRSRRAGTSRRTRRGCMSPLSTALSTVPPARAARTSKAMFHPSLSLSWGRPGCAQVYSIPL